MLSVSLDSKSELGGSQCVGRTIFSADICRHAHDMFLYKSHYAAFFGIVWCKSTACEIYGAVPALMLLSNNFFFSISRGNPAIWEVRGEHCAVAAPQANYKNTIRMRALPACIIIENRYVRTLPGWTRNRNGVTLQHSRKISEVPMRMRLHDAAYRDEHFQWI